MARIAWNAAGSRFYEAGVDQGVLYIDALAGVPWIGLISVEENPTGADPKPYYIDGYKYLNLSNADEFEATINAYTYPVEFAECDGTARVRSGLFMGQQKRKSFCFSYRTKIGNDTNGTGHGYKLHLVYNALATPSSRSISSFGDTVEASDFSWSITTQARRVSGLSPTAHVVVDSRFTHPVTMGAIEDILYGSETNVARMPTPEELVAIFDTVVAWEVTNNGDGTFLVNGPDSNVLDIGLGKVTLTHPSVTVIDEDSFTITY